MSLELKPLLNINKAEDDNEPERDDETLENNSDDENIDYCCCVRPCITSSVRVINHLEWSVVWLVHDVICYVLLISVVLYIYMYISGPRSQNVYIGLCVWFWFLQWISNANRLAIRGLVWKNALFKGRLKQVYIFFFLHWSGWELLIRSALVSVFFTSGIWFLFDNVWIQTSNVWIRTTTEFSGVVQPICEVRNRLNDVLPIFFSVTNEAAVIDTLLIMFGVYFPVMMYRMRARQFLATANPKFERACDRTTQDISFDNDVVAQTATVLFGFLVAVVPFILFKDIQRAFRFTWFWVASFLLVTLTGISMFCFNDLFTLFFAFVIPGSYIKREYTSYGVESFKHLAFMCGSSILLCIPPIKTSRSVISVIDTGEPIHDKTIEEARIPDVPVVDDEYESIDTGFIRDNSSYLITFWKLLFSQSFLLAVLLLFLTSRVSNMGLPLTDVTFSKQADPPPLWPAYANFNRYESAIFESRGIKDLAKFQVGNLTKGTEEFIKYLLHQAPCIPNPFGGGIFNVHNPKLEGFGMMSPESIHQGGDMTLKASDFCIDSLAGGLDKLTEWIIEGEYKAVDIIYDVAKISLSFIKVLGISFNLDKLDQYITEVIANTVESLKVLEDVLTTANNILSYVPDLFMDIPMYIVLCLMGISIFAQALPAVGSLLFLCVMLAIMQAIAVVALVLLLLRYTITKAGYNVHFHWNYTTLVLDIFVVVFVIGVSLALRMYDKHDIEFLSQIREVKLEMSRINTKATTGVNVGGGAKILCDAKRIDVAYAPLYKKRKILSKLYTSH